MTFGEATGYRRVSQFVGGSPPIDASTHGVLPVDGGVVVDGLVLMFEWTFAESGSIELRADVDRTPFSGPDPTRIELVESRLVSYG